IGAAGTNNAKGMSSINWEIGVLPVRVLGRCGAGSLQDVVDAIRWAAGFEIRAGVGEPAPPPKNPNPARIINLSLGMDRPCTLEIAGHLRAAIEDAVAAGVVVVAAAGNSAIEADGATPAGCPGVITDAASDARGHLVARYSNWGPRVDVLAPGGDGERDDDGDKLPDSVWSAVKPGGDWPDGIAPMDGTSMAAPHVSGVIALGMAAIPELLGNPTAVLDRLRKSVLPVSKTECPKLCGTGFLNADKFVRR
ncbi:MAG: S8 family serine peptidase, partial [Hyphomicrobiaceae bacterium]